MLTHAFTVFSYKHPTIIGCGFERSKYKNTASILGTMLTSNHATYDFFGICQKVLNF